MDYCRKHRLLQGAGPLLTDSLFAFHEEFL